MEDIKRNSQNILLSYKSIYGWMNLKTYIFMIILVPFSQTALFSYLNYFIKGESGMKYAALGNAMYTICIFVVFSMGTSITTERRLGTLQIILLSPQNKVALFATKSVLHIIEGVITACFSLILGAIFFELNFYGLNCFSLVGIIILTSAMMIGVGLFAGVMGLLFRRATPILNFIILSIFLLCGVNFPVSSLPKVIQYISNIIPLTHGIKILRAMYNREIITNSSLLYLCLTGLVFFVISYSIFVFCEDYCRRKGSLEYY